MENEVWVDQGYGFKKKECRVHGDTMMRIDVVLHIKYCGACMDTKLALMEIDNHPEAMKCAT